MHELVPCPSSTRTISVLMVSEATATCRSGFALRVQDGTAALPVGAFIRLVPNEGRECIFVEEEAVSLSFDRIDASFTDCWMMLSLGLCDRISGGLSIRPVSGVVGVGRQARWCADVKPDRQALYESNVLDEPLMAFYLTRFRNVTGAQAQEPGGVFTLGLSRYHNTACPSSHACMTGSTNTSLYTGQIDYQDIPSSFISSWTLAIKNLTIRT